MPTNTVVDGEPILILSDADVEPIARNRIQAARAGDRMLDQESASATEAVYDSLPGVVARKLRAITPENFSVAEITIVFKLGGKIPPVELGGQVTVKFKPKA